MWSRAHSMRRAPASAKSDIRRRCSRVDFRLAVSSGLPERRDGKDHHPGPHDAIEERIDRPRWVDISWRRDLPRVERTDDWLYGSRVDDVALGDAASGLS